MKFGQTWWGEAWLDAFKDIDFSNRLPRGRSYANKGAATQIEIGDTTVTARVQGRRRAPYRVTIAFDAFDDKQCQRVLETLSGRPRLLSQLLNRQLPTELLPLMAQTGVKLFPDSWQDIDARCSCPDWAVPCKHIAAVIYLIANEIDKNPFRIFQLHGMDLMAEVERQTGVQLATLDAPPILTQTWCDEPGVDYWQSATTEALDTLDLTKVPPLGERLFSILSPRPLFHPRDFHQWLQGHYKRAARAAVRFDREESTPWAVAEQLADLSLLIDDSGRLVAVESDECRLSRNGTLIQEFDGSGTPTQRPADLGALVRLLKGLESAQEPRLAPPLLLWRRLFRLALKLVEHQAMVPEICLIKGQQARIRWRPAPFSEPIQALVAAFYPLCPPDLVVMAVPSGKDEPDWHFAPASEQIHTALHMLMQPFLEQGLASAPAAQQQDSISLLFCGDETQTFERFEEREHPRVIHHWLMPLYLCEREHRLSVWVEEREADVDTLALQVRVEHRNEDGNAPRQLRELLDVPGLSATKMAVLTDLAMLATHLPETERLYGESGETELVFRLAEFSPILRRLLPALRALGIGVHLPRGLRNLAFPRLSLSLARTDTEVLSDAGYLNLDQLLSFDWQIALGDQRLSIEAFRELLQNAEGLIRLQDEYVMLDEGDLQQLLRSIERLPERLSHFELLRAGLAEELAGARVDLDDESRELFQGLLRTQPLCLPAGLDAELRPYQRRGFEWLAQNARLGFGSLIADDMGLGKTLQVITLILHLKAQGQLEKQAVLVVVPTTLLTNWHKELQRFAPTLSCQIYHGPQRQLESPLPEVVLTSYGLARTDNRLLAKHPWRALIIDEAQNIKNPASQQTRAIKKIKSDIRIGMSGTPVENHLGEYWSLFDFTNPGYLGPQQRFQKELAGPIENERDQQRLSQFRRITAPFILRRLKTDRAIIQDLPAKLESNRYCNLSPQQAALYQRTVDAQLELLAEVEPGVDRRGLIFKLLNALKQICNSPAQYLGQDRAVTAESGKLASFVELMGEIGEAGEKTLIFTQYRRMGELLCRQLEQELGMAVPMLHGGLSRGQRDELVNTFQNDHRARALVLSLKAGGTGLNLTAASQVIHYDLWWNPAVEAQATDRAYRIGQQRRVQVHRLITEHSFEEKIDQMIQSKRELADLSVASGEQWLTELSDTELRELVSLNPVYQDKA